MNLFLSFKESSRKTSNKMNIIKIIIQIIKVSTPQYQYNQTKNQSNNFEQLKLIHTINQIINTQEFVIGMLT